MNFNDYGGTVTLEGKDMSTIMGGFPTMDLSQIKTSRIQEEGEMITETVPYVLSKDGPNAH
jgi:hypothetical protein